MTDVEAALGVIATAVRNRALRLKRGTARRVAMAAALAQGRDPQGPRARWLEATSRRVLAVLEEQAVAFNAAQPDDLISVQDFGDALATALAALAAADEA